MIFMAVSVFCLARVDDDVQAQDKASYNKTLYETDYINVFPVPEKLRNRVDFWKKVFVEYGENNIIVHHRMYPQVIFSVVDISDSVEGYNDVRRELYKKKREEEIVATIKSAFENIIRNGEPETVLEQKIYKAMQRIPGGSDKFRKALDDDLIRTQTGIKERYEEAIIKSGRYLPLMEQIFRAYGLPVELTRLPFVESSFDLYAKSSVGALGLWQFMKSTGKSYMSVNDIVDQRRDPIASTHAAAKYFLSAKSRLGAWPFAITSYNHGISGMAKKIAMMGLSNISDMIEHPSERVLGFASNNFYPSFLAAVEIYRDKKKYFPGIVQDEVIRYKERALTDSISIYRLAKIVGVGVETLRDYNPALSELVWSGRVPVPRGYNLRIPIVSEEKEDIRKKGDEAIISDSSEISDSGEPEELPDSRSEYDKPVKSKQDVFPKSRLPVKLKPDKTAKPAAKKSLKPAKKAQSKKSLKKGAVKLEAKINNNVKKPATKKTGIKSNSPSAKTGNKKQEGNKKAK